MLAALRAVRLGTVYGARPGGRPPGTPAAHLLSRGLRSASPAPLRPALAGNPCARSAHPRTPGAHPLSHRLRSASPAPLCPALVGNPCARSAHPRNPQCAPALVVGLGQLRWIREANGAGEANSRVRGPSPVRDHEIGASRTAPIS